MRKPTTDAKAYHSQQNLGLGIHQVQKGPAVALAQGELNQCFFDLPDKGANIGAERETLTLGHVSQDCAEDVLGQIFPFLLQNQPAFPFHGLPRNKKMRRPACAGQDDSILVPQILPDFRVSVFQGSGLQDKSGTETQ